MTITIPERNLLNVPIVKAIIGSPCSGKHQEMNKLMQEEHAIHVLVMTDTEKEFEKFNQVISKSPEMIQRQDLLDVIEFELKFFLGKLRQFKQMQLGQTYITIGTLREAVMVYGKVLKPYFWNNEELYELFIQLLIQLSLTEPEYTEIKLKQETTENIIKKMKTTQGSYIESLQQLYTQFYQNDYKLDDEQEEYELFGVLYLLQKLENNGVNLQLINDIREIIE